MRSRSLRPAVRLLTIALAASAAIGVAPAAQAATPRVATTVAGWAAAPTAVRAGGTYRADVRVSGGVRVVRLERLVRDGWRVVDRERSSAAGRVGLAWRVPTTATRAVLRVHVLHTASARAALTSRLAVTVRPTAAEALRAKLLVLVNEARATARSCGGTAFPAAPALRRSAALDRAAGDYALKMGKERFFDHTSPDGSTMASRLQAVGIANTTERENIAAGQTSAAAVMAAWLRSPGHCANIMARDVTRVGLGHADVPGSPYTRYWVQDFAG